MTRVPVAPLQRAFLESGESASEVATRAGWVSNERPDSSRVLRVLGLAPWTAAGGRRWTDTETSLKNAATLCRALHLDPIDVGL